MTFTEAQGCTHPSLAAHDSLEPRARWALRCEDCGKDATVSTLEWGRLVRGKRSATLLEVASGLEPARYSLS